MDVLQKIDNLLAYIDKSQESVKECMPDRYVRLYDGTRVPIVALGTWKSEKGVVQAVVEKAIKNGYRHIDCAKAYGNEKEVGAAITKCISEGIVSRKDLYIVSKLWNAHHSPEHVISMVKSSLSDLGIKYLDLYLMHWPMSFEYPGKKVSTNNDPNQPVNTMFYTGKVIPILDTYKEMEKCVKLGLIKNIGISNFNHKQIIELLNGCNIKPAMLQNECHLYNQCNKIFEFCKKHSISFTGYSPLGSNDRPWATKDDPSVLDDPKVKIIADKYSKTTAQILLKFQVQRGIIVPPKTTKEFRLIENINIFDFDLTDQEMNELKSYDRNWKSCIPPAFPRNHPYWPFKEEW